MKKWPKYIVLPVALFLYFITMAVYGIKQNDWRLPEDFWTIVIIETVVLVALFFVLKKRGR